VHIDELHPRDAQRQYGPEVADLIRRHRALQCRHEQICAACDELLDITHPGARGVELVEHLDQLLRQPVPK
jgi:hypothetical protein